MSESEEIKNGSDEDVTLHSTPESSSDKYYDDFFRYAWHYGDSVARLRYCLWSPPLGTENPYGKNRELEGEKGRKDVEDINWDKVDFEKFDKTLRETIGTECHKVKKNETITRDKKVTKNPPLQPFKLLLQPHKLSFLDEGGTKKDEVHCSRPPPVTDKEPNGTKERRFVLLGNEKQKGGKNEKRFHGNSHIPQQPDKRMRVESPSRFANGSNVGSGMPMRTPLITPISTTKGRVDNFQVSNAPPLTGNDIDNTHSLSIESCSSGDGEMDRGSLHHHCVSWKNDSTAYVAHPECTQRPFQGPEDQSCSNVPFARMPRAEVKERGRNPYLSPTNINFTGPFQPSQQNNTGSRMQPAKNANNQGYRLNSPVSTGITKVPASNGDRIFLGGANRGFTFKEVLIKDPGYAQRSIQVCKSKCCRPWPDLDEYLLYLVSFESSLKTQVLDFFEWSKYHVRDRQDSSIGANRTDLLLDSEIKTHMDIMSQVTIEACQGEKAPFWFDLLHRVRRLLIAKQHILPEDSKDLVEKRMKNCWFNMQQSIRTNDLWYYNMFFKEMMYYVQWYYPHWLDSSVTREHERGFKIEEKKYRS